MLLSLIINFESLISFSFSKKSWLQDHTTEIVLGAIGNNAKTLSSKKYCFAFFSTSLNVSKLKTIAF